MESFIRVGAAVLLLVGGGLQLFGNDKNRLAHAAGLFSDMAMPQITLHTTTEPGIDDLQQTPADMALDAAEEISRSSALSDDADTAPDVWGNLAPREDPFTKSSVFPRRPLLRLNTDQHTDKIKRIDLDARDRYLVTSSYDKTARVWKMPERMGDAPKLLRVLRPPIGAGHLGRIFGVALSPDGKSVAVAGWTHWVAGVSEEDEFLYLFDRETGVMTRRFAGLDDIVHDLAFSPDGRFLVAGMSRNGIRVFDMTATDKDKMAKDKAYGGQVYGLAFAPDGRLATASYDGLVRLYGADLSVATLTPQMTTYTPHGEQPHDLAFSPDGQKIAVGYYDQRQISLLSSADLTELASPKTDGVENGDLLTVRWSQDGRYLYAAGRWHDEDGRNLIRRWEQDGQGAFEDIVVAEQSVLDLHSFGPGGIAFAAADPTVGAIDGKGQTRVQPLPPASLWLRASDALLTVSEDGAKIDMSYGKGADRLSVGFDVRDRRLELDMGEGLENENEGDGHQADTGELSDQQLTAPDSAIEITGWHDSPTPRINGEAIYLPNGEWSRAMSLAPDGQHVLLGTEKNIRYYDASGKQLWQYKAPAAAARVAISGDGRKAVVAYRDGTVRWHRLTDGQELFALFVDDDLARWVFWTPSGLYDAAPDADDLIGWHINQGDDKEALFYGASRFKDLFYRPDLVATALDTLQHPPAPSHDRILANLPPVVRILAITRDDTGAPIVEYQVNTPSRDPVATLRVTVDGRSLDVPMADLEQTASGTFYLPLTCEQGDVEVLLAAKTAASGYGDADTAPLGSLCNFDS